MSKPKASAAGYVRMSSAKQDQSPDRQRQEITTYAEANGYKVTNWYEDLGKTGTESKKRVGFQKLLVDSAAGKVSTVIMFEISRFSREEPLKALAHLQALKEAGVSIYTVAHGEVDLSEISGLVMNVINAHGAHDESKKISQRVVSGKKKQAKDGRPTIVNCFGFDRLIVAANGDVLRRVKFGERFQKPSGCGVKRVVSGDVEIVDAIRWGFGGVASGELSLANVRDEWNRRGIPTFCGREWRQGGVSRVLKNPTYCGRLRVGHYSRAKFNRIYESMELLNGQCEAIVSESTFHRAQQALKARSFSSERRHKFLLSGLTFCGNCGCGLIQAVDGNRGRASERFYRCSSEKSRLLKCGGLNCRAPLLDAVVVKAIRDFVLTKENIARIAAYQEKVVEDPRVRELQSLRESIAVGTRNLLLAATEHFVTLQDHLTELKTKERQLDADIKADSFRDTNVSSQAMSKWLRHRDRLQEADVVELRSFLRTCIEGVVVKRERLRSGDRVWSGRIVFDNRVTDAAPVEITHADLGEKRILPLVTDVARKAGKPVTIKTLAQETGRAECQLRNVVKKGVRLGYLLQSRIHVPGPRGGRGVLVYEATGERLAGGVGADRPLYRPEGHC